MTNSDQPLAISVATFAADLSSQDKQDVSDLLLQADIFASTTWNRRDYWKSWADYHRNRMLKHGCSEHSVIATPALFLTRKEELDESIHLDIVGVERSRTLPELAIKCLEGSGYIRFAREFLRSGSAHSHLGDFQVVPCVRNSNGEVEIFVCGLHVVGRVDDGKRELALRFNGGSYLFSAECYAKYRGEIRKHLERYAEQRIRHIEL